MLTTGHGFAIEVHPVLWQDWGHFAPLCSICVLPPLNLKTWMFFMIKSSQDLSL